MLTVLAFAPARPRSTRRRSRRRRHVAIDPSTRAFDPIVARGEHVAPGTARELSKKEEWLREKTLRPDFHTTDADLARALALAAKQGKAEGAVGAQQAGRGARDRIPRCGPASASSP